MAIRHHFNSPIDDEGIPEGQVKPSNWNAEHDVEGLLGALLTLGLQPNVVPYLDAGQAGATFSISDFVRTLVMNVADAAAFRALLNAAALTSPAFNGAPTAPTQGPGDNSTKLATTAYTDAAIASLLASAPAALDTLNELAAALGNDANFAATVTNALALKAALNSPTFTGAPLAPTPAGGDNSTKIATTAFIVALLAAYAPRASPTFTGTPAAPTAAAGTATTQLATTAFVIAALNRAQVIANGTDFDTIAAEGTYYNTGTCANTPVASGSFYLHVQAGPAGGNVAQRAVELTTGNAYQRVKSAGTWQPWTTVGFTVGQIPATATTTQPGAGKVGELLTANNSINFGASSTPVNVTSFVLTPGVWDLELAGSFGGSGSTTSNDWIAAISTASGTVSGGVVVQWHNRAPAGLDYNWTVTSPHTRVAVAVNTTYYLNAQATFSGSTFGFSGTVNARRV
jgi:hypothetical protein